LSNIANLKEEDEQLIKFDSTFDELKDFDGENLLGRGDTQIDVLDDENDDDLMEEIEVTRVDHRRV